MEQKDDFKLELQQELRGLQQEIAQHSTLHKDMLQRSVKRRTKNSYFGALFTAIFFMFLMVASTIFKVWPWWFLIPFDLLLGIIVVEALILSKDFRKADVQSREGLLSLRESMRKRSKLSKRKRIFLKIISWTCWIVTPLMLIYVYLYQRDIFFLVLGTLICSDISWVMWLRDYIKKENDDFAKEIDELLKEE